MSLRDLRKNAGLCQDAVAKLLDVSQGAVSRWESGKMGIARKHQKRLAKLYGVKVDELLKQGESGKKGR